MPRAHLLAFIDTTHTPPIVVGAGIYSEDAGSITTDQRHRQAVEVGYIDGETFGDAHETWLELVNSNPHYEWLQQFISKPD